MAKVKTNQKTIKCSSCGSNMQFDPARNSLKCPQCGSTGSIMSNDDVSSAKLKDLISQKTAAAPVSEVFSVTCEGCGAAAGFDSKTASTICAYCGSPLIAEKGSTSSIITPQGILPFKVTKEESVTAYKNWIKGLRFAPSRLAGNAKAADIMQGVYIPYWLFDVWAEGSYIGGRGINFNSTEKYIDEEGKKQKRTVTDTKWENVSGKVDSFMHDLLVTGSNTLPWKMTSRLEPWNLKDLKKFDSRYLVGFQTENYHYDPTGAFDALKTGIHNRLESEAKTQIGGDTQSVAFYDIEYKSVDLRHVLLPIWINSFRYNRRIYRFIVNGRTGEVQGERPWSLGKIMLAVLAVMVLLFFVYVILENNNFF